MAIGILTVSLTTRGRVQAAETAGQPSDNFPRSPALRSPERRPSFRFGVYGGTSFGHAEGHGVVGPGDPYQPGEVRPFPLPMIGVNVGVQFDVRTALYLRAHFGTLVFFLNQAALETILEANLTPQLALGGGIGVAAMRNVACWYCSGPSSHDWSGVTIPLVASYSFRKTVRSSFRVTLEGAVGSDPRHFEEWSLRGAVAVGYEWM